MDNHTAKPWKVRFHQLCCSYGAAVHGVEHNKSNWSKPYLGRLRHSKAAILSLSVIWILSDFLYFNCLVFRLSCFCFGERQSCWRRVEQNNSSQVNVVTVPLTITLFRFYKSSTGSLYDSARRVSDTKRLKKE